VTAVIDVHCHILPGLDDGARDLPESLAMARILVEQGYTGVIATPHVVESELYNNSFEDISRAVESFRSALQSENIPLEVYTGAEYHYDRSLPELIRYRYPLATMAGGLYMLVELPVMYWPSYLAYSMWPKDDDSQEMRKLIPFIRPVIAHPERNQEMLQRFKRVHALRNHGYLFQVNLESVVGLVGKKVTKFIKRMAKESMIDFIGTDGHSVRGLEKLFPDWRRKAEKIIGAEKLAKIMTENPQSIIADEPLDLDD